MTHWGLWAVGRLADGTRLMIIKVCRQEWKLGFRNRNVTFAVVLECRPEGLFRLSRNRPEKLVGPGFVWPAVEPASDTAGESLHREQGCLGAVLPKYWGSPNTLLQRRIPDRILRSSSANIGRLLLAWTKSMDDAFAAMAAGSEKQFLPGAPLPPSPFWRPVAIVIIPNTDVVVRAVHSGVLLERLKTGLERIYVSEMAWIRAPSVKAPLMALAHRFPTRLVLVKAEGYLVSSMRMKIKRVRAAEYQFIGYQLQDRYQDDFGYDKFDSPKALDGMFRFRIGDVPRGHMLLWIYEQDVPIGAWANLDIDGMKRLEQLAGQRREAQNKRAAEAIRLTLKAQAKE